MRHARRRATTSTCRTPGIAQARTTTSWAPVWYFRQFDLPKLPADSIAQLHFGGTFYKARVWLNGVEVGAHEGGYSEFSFDVIAQLRDRQPASSVAVDNRPGMFTIPGFGARGAPDAWYDWWAYGGIVRDVWLDIHGPVRIDRPVHPLEARTATKAIVTQSRDARAAHEGAR